MAKKKRKIGGGGVEEVNLTPMIDCTFQLIIFFIITAQMANQDLAKIAVAEPATSRAVEPDKELPNVCVVNIINEYGDQVDKVDKDGNIIGERVRDPLISARAKEYRIGVKTIAISDAESLVQIFKERRKSAKEQGFKEFFVEIRGDKDIAYAGILPVMQAAAEAGIAKMFITAIVDPNFEAL